MNEVKKRIQKRKGFLVGDDGKYDKLFLFYFFPFCWNRRRRITSKETRRVSVSLCLPGRILMLHYFMPVSTVYRQWNTRKKSGGHRRLVYIMTITWTQFIFLLFSSSSSSFFHATISFSDTAILEGPREI